MINIDEDDNALIQAYVNRIKILEFVQNSRNFLFNFSIKSYEDSSNILIREIKSLKNKYV